MVNFNIKFKTFAYSLLNEICKLVNSLPLGHDIMNLAIAIG